MNTQHHVARTLLARDLMKKPRTANPDQRVYDVVKMLTKNGISGAPVVDSQGKLLGMLSEQDCIRALLGAVMDNLPSHRVRDVMSTELTTLPPETHVLTVAHVFLNKRLRRIPIVDRHGHLVGMITRGDLLRKAVDVFETAPNRKSAILYLSALEGTIPPG